MKKENILVEIISWAMVIFFIVLLCSCASRKVSTSKTKEETKTEKVNAETAKTETDTKSETTVTENVSFDVISESENLVPVDPLKPITKTETISGNTKTTVWNNATVNRNQTTDKSEKVSEIKRNEEETVKCETKKDEQENASTLNTDSNRESERREPIVWYLIALGGVILFFIWFDRRKSNS